MDESSLTRAVQLIGKTNQFNLSGRCYTVKELLCTDQVVFVLKLVDRLEDYGITATVVARIVDAELVVENWAMSCRVMMRGVEDATLQLLQRYAVRLGLSRVVVRYHESGRNAPAIQAMSRLGLVPRNPRELVCGANERIVSMHHVSIN